MDRIEKLFDEVISQMDKINMPYSKNIVRPVIINSRVQSRLGRCEKRSRYDSELYKIKISKFMLNADDNKIKNILAHEIIHTCPKCMNHGAAWKAQASKMNNAYSYNIKRTEEVDSIGIKRPEKRINYIIKCTACDHEYKRQSESVVIKHPENYRCKCGGSLIRIK